MPTALIPRRSGERPPAGLRPSAVRVALLLCASILAAGASGCVSNRPGVVVDDVLLPLEAEAAWLPRESDLAAAELARAALATTPMPGRRSDPIQADDISGTHGAVSSALDRLMAAEDEADQRKLIAIALDVRNATLDDPIAYRAGAREVRKRRGIDPRLRNRLDRVIADDPVDLARQRGLDDWRRLWARTFNTVSEPLGSSAITGFTIAPYQLANSIVHYFAGFSNSEPISRTGRQALALRKNFLLAHPDTQWTEKLEKLVARDTLLLAKTLARRRIRVADRFLDAGQPRIAAYHLSQAEKILNEHPGAHRSLERKLEKLSARSQERIEIARQHRLRSLEAGFAPPKQHAIEVDWAASLLAAPVDFDRIESSARAFESAGGPTDRADFVRALAQHERGFEAKARERLSSISAARDTESRTVRHARALLDDEWQNPYRAFEKLRAKAKRDELAYRLAGEWVNRPRYPNLSAPIAYLIDSPTIALTVVMAPLRVLLSPWQGGPDFERGAALAGYRYLGRYPEGAAQREILSWLFEYETKQERPARALRLADMIPNFDAEERRSLVEETAKSRLDHVESIDRRDARASILKGVAREFPDSEKGREAGLAARAEALDASAQHIRITKSFLMENRDVAGREGVGLNPRLLNEDPSDGELHPEGVLLRGGRTLEIRLIAEGADDEDPPESIYRKVGQARLAQLAASLDAAVHRNSLADLEARQTPDANRDVYLERAGLRLTEDIDARPTAESNFVYQSLRERYGLVRGRESILPFDLVFRGSLGDFSLGAFPRWRAPKTTPDAFLYR